ncbi:peroxiredoxin family protein [Rummeliibacillus stabekisii]|uniref:peroxiredoxin family protein n=1 Tax=Rummeliibacillus stabekisii TaxID=241244 RepID=UPI0037196C7C
MKKKVFGLLLVAALIVFALTNFLKSKITEAEKIDTSYTQVETKQTENSGLEIGQYAPDFTLKTLEGKKVKLSDYRGKKVILNFWATWCPPCKEEIPHMEKYYKSLNKKDNVEILAVNLTSSDKSKEYIKEFAESYDITYPILLDKEGEQQKQYEIVTIPTTFFINESGQIKQKAVGPMDKGMMENTMKILK